MPTRTSRDVSDDDVKHFEAIVAVMPGMLSTLLKKLMRKESDLCERFINLVSTSVHVCN